MRSFPTEQYRFDRMFMLHLASQLRTDYDPLVRGVLPAHFWDMLLKLALLEALSEKRGANPGMLNRNRVIESIGSTFPMKAASTTQRLPQTPTVGRLS